MERNALSRRFTAASLLRFSAANVVMMIFLSLYTIVDGMFISRLVGTLALSAVNMSYPLNSLELALGIMLGTGASAVIAREMGAGEAELARRDFSCVVAVAAAAAACLPWRGTPFWSRSWRRWAPALCSCPTRKSILDPAVVRAGAVFADGVSGPLCDGRENPAGPGHHGAGRGFQHGAGLLVHGPPGDGGWPGAAVATGVGYCIPAAAGLYYFLRPRDSALWFVSFRPRWAMLLHTCGNGSSEMVSNIANALTTFLFNIIFLRFWGEDGVASITIAHVFPVCVHRGVFRLFHGCGAGDQL